MLVVLFVDVEGFGLKLLSCVFGVWAVVMGFEEFGIIGFVVVVEVVGNVFVLVEGFGMIGLLVASYEVEVA